MFKFRVLLIFIVVLMLVSCEDKSTVPYTQEVRYETVRVELPQVDYEITHNPTVVRTHEDEFFEYELYVIKDSFFTDEDIEAYVVARHKGEVATYKHGSYFTYIGVIGHEYYLAPVDILRLNYSEVPKGQKFLNSITTSYHDNNYVPFTKRLPVGEYTISVHISFNDVSYSPVELEYRIRVFDRP